MEETGGRFEMREEIDTEREPHRERRARDKYLHCLRIRNTEGVHWKWNLQHVPLSQPTARS
jgi:hypothetical protein